MAKQAQIRVVVVAPDQGVPTVKTINNELSELQAIVGGHIELVYYDQFELFCNEEGKLEGLPLNRPLYDENGKMVEVLAGQFFITKGDKNGDLRDLTDEEIAKAIELFTFTPESYDKFIENLRAIGVKVVY
jgi:hypothetical protein